MLSPPGVLKLGAVSLDGTRLQGAGSKQSVRSLAEIDAELEALAQELCAQADTTDLLEQSTAGDSLPPELADAATRRATLQAAKAQIEERRARAHAEGRRPGPQSAQHTASVSLTEPESRRLRRGHSGGAVQGYNAQAAVDAGASGLIVGAHLSDEPAENYLLEAGVQAVLSAAGAPAVILVDKGYEGAERRVAVEERYGVTVLCPPQRRFQRGTRTKARPAHEQRVHDLQSEMRQRLEQPHWQTLYRRRRVTVEPAFARLKTHMGFTRFRCWGRVGAAAEWTLICLAHNLRLLSRPSA